MIERKVIERILTANGVDPTAPDEQIKSVLISAKWHEQDVETAIMVLKENTDTEVQHVDSLHKVFRTEDRLNPTTISSLLGIDVDIPVDPAKARRTKNSMAAKDMATIGVISLGLSFLFVMSAMWYLQMGLFYNGIV